MNSAHTSSLFSPDGGSSDSALIGGVAGGVGGGLLLCCLLLVVAAIVWGARRGRSPYRKLVQPDYEAVAYGDVKEDVTLPKKQQEVSALCLQHPPTIYTRRAMISHLA